MAVRLPWWKSLLYMGVAVILFVVGIEGSARVYRAIRRGPHSLLFGFTEKGDLLTRYHFAVDPIPPGSAEQIKIMTFGGSSTYGVGAPPDQSYPVHLEHILNAGLNAKRFHVMNAGISRSNSGHLRAIYAKAGSPEVDLIIVYNGHNNYANSRLGRPRSNNLFMQLTVDAKELLVRYSLFYVLLIEKVALLRHGDPSFVYSTPPGRWNVGDLDGIVVTGTTNNASILDILAEREWAENHYNAMKSFLQEFLSRKIKILLVKQVFGVHPKEVEQVPTLVNEKRSSITLHEFWAIGTYRVHANYDRLGRELGIAVVDAFHEMWDRTQFKDTHVDRIHLKSEGNRILAEIISPEVKKLLPEESNRKAVIEIESLLSSSDFHENATSSPTKDLPILP